MNATCEKVLDTTAMPPFCEKAQGIFDHLQEDLSAALIYEDGVIKLALEIAGFEYEEAFNKMSYLDELCNNITQLELPETTIVTFSFIRLRDLNQLRDLLQTTQVLPRLANVRFGVNFCGKLAFFGDVIFRGMERGFEGAGCAAIHYAREYAGISYDKHAAHRLDHEVRTMLADYGRKLDEKPSRQHWEPFPFLKLSDEL